MTEIIQIGSADISASVNQQGAQLWTLRDKFGFHPAFRWPLIPGTERERHVCVFEKDEQAPLRHANVATGLLRPTNRDSPVKDRRLAMHDGLFSDGALIFDRHVSRSLWYGVPGEIGIKADFPLMPTLGLWTRPGYPFFCIE